MLKIIFFVNILPRHELIIEISIHEKRDRPSSPFLCINAGEDTLQLFEDGFLDAVVWCLPDGWSFPRIGLMFDLV